MGSDLNHRKLLIVNEVSVRAVMIVQQGVLPSQAPFRHAFAELAFASGLPEQVVSVLMGHKLTGMSFCVYAGGNPLDRRQAILSLVIPPEIRNLTGKGLWEGSRPPRVIARKRRLVKRKPRRRLPDAAE